MGILGLLTRCALFDRMLSIGSAYLPGYSIERVAWSFDPMYDKNLWSVLFLRSPGENYCFAYIIPPAVGSSSDGVAWAIGELVTRSSGAKFGFNDEKF